MSVKIDLKGQTFGFWKVLRADVENTRGQPRWMCKCKCGTLRSVAGPSLRTGLSSSCGCLKSTRDPKLYKQPKKVIAKKHLHVTHSDVYDTLRKAIDRCHNPAAHAYDKYGARGIKVCKRWQEPDGVGLKNFMADMGPRPDGYTLERKDNSKGYSPVNCIWATRKTQTRNRGVSYPPVVWKGVSRHLGDWIPLIPITASWETLAARIFLYGWTPQRAFTTPVRKVNR